MNRKETKKRAEILACALRGVCASGMPEHLLSRLLLGDWLRGLVLGCLSSFSLHSICGVNEVLCIKVCEPKWKRDYLATPWYDRGARHDEWEFDRRLLARFILVL